MWVFIDAEKLVVNVGLLPLFIHQDQKRKSNAISSEGMHHENITTKPYPIKILTLQ
jgi:hypothetical protein